MLPDMWSKLHDIEEGKIIQNNNIERHGYNMLFLNKHIV